VAFVFLVAPQRAAKAATFPYESRRGGDQDRWNCFREPQMPRRLLFRLLSAAEPAGDQVTDAALLRRYSADRDAAAFELLVRRHADAVWAACRRILPEHDAEDAFQAAFLVLARKASAIRGVCVGGWLHRVAVNAALKLRARARRHTASEFSGEPAGVETASAVEQAELAATVHEELARLPERYRLPVVLCDLEGQTHADAARVLGWPVGSVSGRLSRAREILRDRLTRRGLAAPAVLFGVLAAPAPVVTAAITAAGNAAIASPVVSTLAEGVLSAMRTAKLKLTAAVVAAAGFVLASGAGAVYVMGRTPDGQPVEGTAAKGPPQEPPAKADQPAAADWMKSPPPTAFPDIKLPENGMGGTSLELLQKACPHIFGDTAPEVVATDDGYRRLLKARLQQGRLYMRRTWDVIQAGRWGVDHVFATFETLEDMRTVAGELWGNDPKSLTPWLEEFVVMGKAFERVIDRRVQVGTDPPQNLNTATRHRLKAEADLWRAKNPQRPAK
jgi:RNA polymerase sigma factor (sigma-70 family)